MSKKRISELYHDNKYLLTGDELVDLKHIIVHDKRLKRNEFIGTIKFGRDIKKGDIYWDDNGFKGKWIRFISGDKNAIDYNQQYIVKTRV